MATLEQARVIRVVAVSPSDVVAERERLAMVIDELNRRVAPAHGRRFMLWRWETDAHPGLHLEGPQGLIDTAMRIEDADVVIGIFWQRFGTPTGASSSGTEHELRRAWSAWRERGRPHVMVYFSDRKSRPKDAAEARQLQELLSFREAMPREQLWWTYTRPIDFERAVREHLVAVAMAVEEWREAASQHVARPGSGTAPASDIRMVVETDVAIEVFDEVPDRPSPEIIIPTGTPVPFTSRLTVMTTTDDQKTISLTLLERSSGTAGSSDIDDFQKLGTPKFILPPGMPRATSVDLAIGVNPTGQLALDATFPETEFPPASATSGELRIRLRKQSS